MKRILTFLAVMAFASTAFAQTAEEIIARMDEVMEQVGEENGLRMTMDLKIPILGTMSTTAYVLGDKMRMEAKMMGKNLVTWQDGVTEWTYDSDENTITIESQDQSKKSEEKENMKMFQSATEGYDVSISKETDQAWTIKCKKNRSNTGEIHALMGANGAGKSTMIKIIAGAHKPNEGEIILNGEQVTFNRADYPKANVIDKR